MRMLVPILAVALSSGLGRVADPPAWGSPPPASAARQVASPDYLFPSGAGLLFFYVRPERAPEFEVVMTRLRELLAASPDTVRQQQAASFRSYRSLEARDERIYVFMFDPAVRDAPYDPVRLLSELAPADVADLYARLKAAIIRVERMGLEKIQ